MKNKRTMCNFLIRVNETVQKKKEERYIKFILKLPKKEKILFLFEKSVQKKRGSKKTI